MGYFSWKTSDTGKSISNCDSSRGTFPVYIVKPDNKLITETTYEGYGVFGGHDAYALIAQWNAPHQCTGDVEHDRKIGINMAFGENPLSFPLKIVENPRNGNHIYQSLTAAENCPAQGFFYSEDEEDDDDLY